MKGLGPKPTKPLCACRQSLLEHEGGAPGRRAGGQSTEAERLAALDLVYGHDLRFHFGGKEIQ